MGELRHHYEVERELAAKLKAASKEDRTRLYSELYDELFQRVPNHPLLQRKTDPELQATLIDAQLRLLKPFLKPGTVFMELGPGDCTLSLAVSRVVKKVYAVDVSREITGRTAPSMPYELIFSNGTNVPVPPASVHVAYSNQLMEHLHPDDAAEQLRSIYQALIPGGVYICITPHRFMGPGDISYYFDEIATGFHLKEYTNTELARLFRSAGFSIVQSYVGIRGKHFFLAPVYPAMIFESLLKPMPYGMRMKLSMAPFIRNFLYIQLIGRK